jgi:hypothetical protein
MAKATETTTAATARGKQLQATVSADVYDAFQDFHWSAKKETVDLVRDALHEYGVKHGFLTTDAEGNTVPTPKA